MYKKRLFLLLALCGLALGGCGDDDDANLPDSNTDPDGMVQPDSMVNQADSLNEVILEKKIRLTKGAADLKFDVPEDTASIAISIEGQSTNSYLISHWVDGAGKELVKKNWQVDALGVCGSCANRVRSQEAVGGAIAPNNEMGEFSSGEHQLSISGDDEDGIGVSEDVIVRVIRKKGKGIPTNGTIDLNIYLSGAGGYTKANVAQDDEFQKIVSNLKEHYLPAGLKIGDIEYFDIDASYRNIMGISGADNDLHKLFREANGRTNQGMNVFFVDNLMDLGPLGITTLLGISGGIPGPVGSHGSDRGGVALALAPHRDGVDGGDPVPVARTFGHELGHHLGLFHTNEQLPLGVTSDPIADTADNDPQNLMYFFPEGVQLSAWQAKVMRANPWVRHPESQKAQ